MGVVIFDTAAPDTCEEPATDRKAGHKQAEPKTLCSPV